MRLRHYWPDSGRGDGSCSGSRRPSTRSNGTLGKEWRVESGFERDWRRSPVRDLRCWEDLVERQTMSFCVTDQIEGEEGRDQILSRCV